MGYVSGAQTVCGAFTLLMLAGAPLLGGCGSSELLSFGPQGKSSPPTGAVAGTFGASSPSLLIVITYGNGWSAEGSGDGLRDIADAIRRQFPNQQVITRGCKDQDNIRQTVEDHRGPVAFVGHSFGGCRSIELAACVNRPVDWMILLDPVPCDDWAFPHPGRYFHIPENVRHATCFYRGAGMFPISYPITNTSATNENRHRSLGHSEFCSNSEVRQCVLDVCNRAQAGEFAVPLPSLAAASH